MITIYRKDETNFSTLGLTALVPTLCEVEEEAGGKFALHMVHPLDGQRRHVAIAPGAIIKAPCPVRETPEVQLSAGAGVAGEGRTVVREIYRVQTGDGSRLHLRAKPNGHILSAYPVGTEVVKVGESDVAGWWKVIVCAGGQKGYMYGAYLAYVRSESEEIFGDNPGRVVRPRMARGQLFRIYKVVRDAKKRQVEAFARHISEDLSGVVVEGNLVLSNVPADSAVAQLLSRADHAHPFSVHCAVTDEISEDYGGRSLLSCLLDPETGIVHKCGARLVRDNFDLYILPGNVERRVGAELRWGKNLLSARLCEDEGDIVTRILPVGRDADGSPLAGETVDSEHVGEFAAISAKTIAYDERVGRELSRNQVLNRLRKHALREFANGCDRPRKTLDVEFVRRELSPAFAGLANEMALHLYDSVPVTDNEAGILATVRMTGYTFDAILGIYSVAVLGDLLGTREPIYGWQIVPGSVQGSKLARGTVGTQELRDLAITAAKVDEGAIGAEHIQAGAIETEHISAETMQVLRIASAVQDEGDDAEIVLDRDRLHFSGREISFNVRGTDGDTVWDEGGLSVPSVSSPSVVRRYTGPAAIVVNPNAAPNGRSVFCALTDALDALSGRFIPAPVTITIAADYADTEKAVLSCTFGAPITVTAAALRTITGGTMLAEHVQNRLTLNSLALASADANAHILQLVGCASVSATNCAFIGNGSTSEWRFCVYAMDGTTFTAESCHTYGRLAAYYAAGLSQISTANCTGSEHGNAYRAFGGSHCSARGTIPAFRNAQSYGDGTGTFVFANGVVQSVGAGGGAPAEPTTVTLSAADTRTNYGGQWYGSASKHLSQGMSGSSTFRGGIWFSNLGAIAGKTVRAAKLRLKRLGGVGAGASVAICVGVMGNSAPGGQISSVATYGALGYAEQNQVVSFSLPAAAVQALADGAGKGLYIYAEDGELWGNRSYSRNFAQFAGVGGDSAPRLSVQVE